MYVLRINKYYNPLAEPYFTTIKNDCLTSGWRHCIGKAKITITHHSPFAKEVKGRWHLWKSIFVFLLRPVTPCLH